MLPSYVMWASLKTKQKRISISYFCDTKGNINLNGLFLTSKPIANVECEQFAMSRLVGKYCIDTRTLLH